MLSMNEPTSSDPTQRVLTRSKSRAHPNIPTSLSSSTLSSSSKALPKARRSTVLQPSTGATNNIAPATTTTTTTTARPIVHLKKTHAHHHHHGRSASEVAKMEGMGIVRQGPAIVSPSKQQQQHQQHSRTSSVGLGSAAGGAIRRQSTIPTTQDPYSIDFQPSLPPSASRPNKRPFSPPTAPPSTSATIPASPPINPSTTTALQFTSPLESPAKRTHFSPSPTPATRVLATGPTRQSFDFTSPTKAYFGPVTITAGPSASKASSSLLSKSPRGLLGLSPAKDSGSGGVGGVRGLLFSHKEKKEGNDENQEGSSRMEVDNDHETTPRASQSQTQTHPQSHSRPSYISAAISNSSQKKMSSIFPSATPVPSTSLDGSSSEDELDFLSPRKKLAMEQERALKRREKETKRQQAGAGRASLGAIRSPPPQSSSSQGLKRASFGFVGGARSSFGGSVVAEGRKDGRDEKMDLDSAIAEEESKEDEMKIITSAPMERQSFAFPPPSHSMSHAAAPLPSYINYTIQPLPPQQGTIDPSLISLSSLPTSASISQSATGAATPRAGPTPTATRTHSYTSSLSGHPTPSGIPRLIRPRSSTITALNATLPSVAPAPISLPAPTATPEEIISPDPSPPETEADLSTSSTISTVSSISSISSGGSEETASRLKHLQDMLSRLAMPRQQQQAPGATGAKARGMEVGDGLIGLGLGAKGAVVGGTKQRSGVMAKREKVMTSTSMTSTSSRGGMGVERERSRKRQSDALLGTARYREEYSVPLKGGDEAAPPQPPPPPTAAAPVTGKRKLERTRSFGGDNDRAPLGEGFGFGSASSRSNLTLAGTSNAIVPAAGSSSTAPTAPARRISMLPSSSSTAPIGSMSSIDSNGATATKTKILKGVVAFVDVRTSEGDDAGMIFVDMLKSMGARVTVRPSSTLTHIIFKSGRPGTLQRYRQIPEANKPFLVGISWVVRCAELEKRVDEKEYVVIDKTATTSKGSAGMHGAGGAGANSQAKELIAAMQKRRRSMEPKAYAALSSSIGPSSLTNTDPTVKALIAASIERARRKSLQYAPKVGSPLAKRVFMMPPEEEEDEDDEEAMRT